MHYVKSTWSKCFDKRILNLYEKVKNETKKLYPHFFEGCEPEFYLNTSTRVLGRCETNWTRSYTKRELNAAINTNSIRYQRAFILLSEYMKNMTDDQIINTLCHEFGHFVAPGCNHDYLWKSRANKIAEQFGQICRRLATNDDTEDFHTAQKNLGIEYKYELQCPQCKKIFGYHNMSYAVKNPEKCTCPVCKTHIVRIK